MKIRATILIASLLILICGCSKSKVGEREEGNYSSVSTDDVEMKEAIAKAKATSVDFIKAFHAQKAGTKNFCVKKPYSEPDGGLEHMWIKITDERNGILEGIIANEAENTREVKVGQRVWLNISEISD
jgi:uncharacterized protein YegJ (DUF2314 family)